MGEILTSRCPQCDSPPMMVFGGGTQAFCGNDDCSILCWNPALSLDENLMNTSFVELKQRGDEEPGDG